MEHRKDVRRHFCWLINYLLKSWPFVRDEYLPLTYFDAIYIIDLCEPLLEVARARIKARGWKNVHVLCQDASRFVLPEWESGAVDPRGSLTAITMSYSLSMASRPRHLFLVC